MSYGIMESASLMFKKSLLVLDLACFTTIGAIAGEIYLESGAIYELDKPVLAEAGAVLGAVVAAFIGLAVFVPSAAGRQDPDWLKRRLVMLLMASFGAVFAARSTLFIFAWPMEEYEKVHTVEDEEEDDPQATVGAVERTRTIMPDGLHFKQAHFHFLSLTLMLGLALTQISGSLYTSLTAEERDGPRSGLDLPLTALLPVTALVSVFLFFNVPSPVTAFIVAVGVFWGWLSGRALYRWHQAPSVDYKTRPANRAAGNVFCAAIILACSEGFSLLPGYGVKLAVTVMTIVAISSVGGILLGASIAGLSGGSIPERRFLSPWLRYSGTRCVPLLLIVFAGAVAGEFCYKNFTLYVYGIEYSDPYAGAILGGFLAFILQIRERERVPTHNGLEEAVALFSSYFMLSVPLGLVFYCGAWAIGAIDPQSEESIIFAVCFGPLVGGTFGMLWRSSRMYGIRTLQEWFALLWGCGVTTFFGFFQHEVLLNLIYSADVVPAVCLISGSVLLIQAVVEIIMNDETGPKPPADPFKTSAGSNGNYA